MSSRAIHNAPANEDLLTQQELSTTRSRFFSGCTEGKEGKDDKSDGKSMYHTLHRGESYLTGMGSLVPELEEDLNSNSIVV